MSGAEVCPACGRPYPAAVEIKLGALMIEGNQAGTPLGSMGAHILDALIQSAPAFMSRRQILDAVHGEGFFCANKAIDVQVCIIRKKIAGTRLSIQTKRGVGYRAVLEPKP